MAQANPPLILIVDDEPIIIDIVSDVLERNGYAWHGCNTAEEAIAFVRANQVELVVTDINLDGVSGLEMCEQIRKLDGCEDLPMMFLSGAQIPDIIRRAHAAGGAYYLRKPFDPEVLIELVDKALWMPHLVRTHVAETLSGPKIRSTNRVTSEQ